MGERTANRRTWRSKTVSASDERFVGWKALQSRQQLFDLNVRRHRNKAPPKSRNGLQLMFRQHQMFFAGSAGGKIDCREKALFGYGTIKDQFHVSCPLEFFEDDLVGAAARVD